MQHAALKLILDEHRALACVLHALRETVANSRKPDVRPDFEHLRAMLFYMDEIPARLHHAAEEQALFPKIRERCPALRPVLDRLEAEHGRGETTVQDLEHALTAWELMGDERREAFELPLRAFVEGYLGHMEVEENYVLPVAQDYLSEADWHDLYAALTDQRRAQAAQTAAGHRALLRRILGGRPAVPPEGD
ncbi:hemerythrin domain-containing protein [Ramlibacter sp. 2FC]|uniref:hemerythrin domain-containing protein n=1 Tax=Ramlibacter sp. 2FC TaxID=2502188 RepID=UPI0010F5AABD|nr:hemerythrin domain-containing protein [Ramlibacter sp. 2FC]